MEDGWYGECRLSLMDQMRSVWYEQGRRHGNEHFKRKTSKKRFNKRRCLKVSREFLVPVDGRDIIEYIRKKTLT